MRVCFPEGVGKLAKYFDPTYDKMLSNSMAVPPL